MGTRPCPTGALPPSVCCGSVGGRKDSAASPGGPSLPPSYGGGELMSSHFFPPDFWWMLDLCCSCLWFLLFLTGLSGCSPCLGLLVGTAASPQLWSQGFNPEGCCPVGEGFACAGVIPNSQISCFEGTDSPCCSWTAVQCFQALTAWLATPEEKAANFFLTGSRTEPCEAAGLSSAVLSVQLGRVCPGFAPKPRFAKCSGGRAGRSSVG